MKLRKSNSWRCWLVIAVAGSLAGLPRPAAAELVLWWQFNGSGTAVNNSTTITDSSASGYNGTFSLTGTASAVFETVTYGTSGVTGTGLNFSPQSSGNGSSIIAIGSFPNLNFGTGDFSVSMWVRKEANTTTNVWNDVAGVQIGDGDFFTVQIGEGFFPATNRPVAVFGTGYNPTTNANKAISPLPVDTTATAAVSHLVSVRSGSTSIIYLDGAQCRNIDKFANRQYVHKCDRRVQCELQLGWQQVPIQCHV